MVRIRSAASLGGLVLVLALLLSACRTTPPAAPGGGPTIDVAAGDDLLAAVASAPAGATLKLADGDYVLRGPLLVDKRLTLVGGGRSKVAVRYDGGAAGDPVLDVEGARFAARGITFRYTGTAPGSVAVVADATIDLERCAFTGGVNGSRWDIGYGLDLHGSTTGTVDRCSFYENGLAGVVEKDAAAVAITASEVYRNGYDGVVFGGTSGGRLADSNVYDHSREGVSVTDDARPTVAGNRLSGNVNGAHYTLTAGGAFQGNTVVANDTGVRFTDSSHPDVIGNDAHDNQACGVRMSGASTPTFVDNAVTGNGINLCDFRTMALPRLPNDCPAGAAGLNPDPANDLAVQVLDANGDPVAGAGVTVQLLDPAGGVLKILAAYAGADGVAVLVDASTSNPPADGSYSAILQADTQTRRSWTLTTCGNLTVPGTFVLGKPDDYLDDVTVSVVDGGTVPNFVAMALGAPWGGQTVMALGSHFLDGVPGRIRPGSYLVSVAADTPTDAYVTYTPLGVAGATALTLDVAAEPTSTVDVDARRGSGAAADRASSYFARQDPSVLSASVPYLAAPSVHLTPGDYWGSTQLTVADGGGTDWNYVFRRGAEHYGPDGSRHTLQVGGALTTALAANMASYAPGATVYLTPTVVDGAGHRLSSVFTSPSSTTVARSVILTPFRPSVAEGASSPQAIGPGQLDLLVLDPNGASAAHVVADVGSVVATYSFGLPPAAVSGTYTASLTLNLGPYQSVPLTASTTFTVQ